MPGSSRTLAVAGATTILAMALASAPVAAGGIKCWTNKHGVRECGNVVPPEYSQEGYEAIGRHGLTIREKERALSDEEIAERARKEREREELESQQAEQAQQDRILLQTYSSEQDILSSRDDKVAALQGSITLAESRLGKLKEDLDSRIEQAAGLERSGKTPSAELLQDIESLERQIARNERFIQDTREEQQRIKESHNADATRFRELQGLAHP